MCLWTIICLGISIFLISALGGWSIIPLLFLWGFWGKMVDHDMARERANRMHD